MSADSAFLYKAAPLQEGYNPIIGGDDTSLTLLDFGRIFLEAGGRYAAESGEREVCLVILCGTGNFGITTPGGGSVLYDDIGGREDVFSGNPAMVYVPRNSVYQIDAGPRELHIAVFSAPARRPTLPLCINGRVNERLSFGASNWRREAWIGLGDDVDVDRLLVGETYNLPGSWSSYPPHKHDKSDASGEEPYEEIYFYMTHPSQGFGVQRIYTEGNDPNPMNEVLVVESGDAVVIPRGYHPVVAAAGYRLTYLWALAGEERRFGSWSDDPDHAWVRELE